MSLKRRPPLSPTARQAEYLTFIRAFTQRWGVPPSFEDIGRHFLTTPPSVNSMIKTLEARGFLARIPGAARTLRVLVPEEQLELSGSRSDQERSRDHQVETALMTASLVVERLVPALEGAELELLCRALDAVAAALDIACTTAGTTPKRRREVQDTLVRVAQLAQGTSPEIRPGRKLPWWSRPR